MTEFYGPKEAQVARVTKRWIKRNPWFKNIGWLNGLMLIEHCRVEARYPKASTTEKLRLAKNRVMRRVGKRAMK